MIRLAQANVPLFGPSQAPLKASTSSAPTSLCSMSRAAIHQVIAQIHTWLREGGFFIFSTVPGDWEDTKITWLGQEVVVESTMSLAVTSPALIMLDLRFVGIL